MNPIAPPSMTGGYHGQGRRGLARPAEDVGLANQRQMPAKSEARSSFARLMASRRLVFTRSPGFLGISDGAATMHSCPPPVICL
jgi:hypothetical protein